MVYCCPSLSGCAGGRRHNCREGCCAVNQIAVCDNDGTDLKLLTAQAARYLSIHPELEGKLCPFGDSGALAASLKTGTRYSLYLLDILMPGVNGIELGRLIRESDEDAPIIYTTSSREYALSAFQNHAMRYLEKPVREAELFSALDLAFLMLRAGEQRSYSVKTRDGYVCLSGRNIVTVENQNRAAVYVLSGGGAVRSVSIRGTFEEAVAPLPDDPDFTRPHKSYYVNMRHIHVLRPGLLLLDDGREISVSRSFSAQVNQDYLRYLSQEEGKTL